MKAFIDTSSLVKKYFVEEGSGKFDDLMDLISEIVISPTYRLEINSAIERRLREKALTKKQALWLRVEVNKDIHYFSTVLWNDNLEEKAMELIQKYQLKTLDSLQLASACLSESDIFISSDKKLFTAAGKELKNVKFI